MFLDLEKKNKANQFYCEVGTTKRLSEEVKVVQKKTNPKESHFTVNRQASKGQRSETYSRTDPQAIAELATVDGVQENYKLFGMICDDYLNVTRRRRRRDAVRCQWQCS